MENTFDRWVSLHVSRNALVRIHANLEINVTVGVLIVEWNLDTIFTLEKTDKSCCIDGQNQTTLMCPKSVFTPSRTTCPSGRFIRNVLFCHWISRIQDTRNGGRLLMVATCVALLFTAQKKYLSTLWTVQTRRFVLITNQNVSELSASGFYF